MSEVKEWIGVDLDGTLAEYHGFKGVDHIGAPVLAMVERVRNWLAEGKTVKIFTARVDGGTVAMNLGNKDGEQFKNIELVKSFIRQWCKVHIGQELEITNVKDYAMKELWDDRAVRVEANTGRAIVEHTSSDPRASDPLFPPNLLRDAASLFEDRNAEYGDTYRRYGKLLLALFPEGGIPAITTPEDATRFNLIMMCLAKLQRYAHNFKKKGHKDSARDLQVYGAMLEEHTD